MKLLNRIFELNKRENECEEVKYNIITDIADLLTKELGMQFECCDSEGSYFYFENYPSDEDVEMKCEIKINLYFLELKNVYCDNEELKQKVYKLFEKRLDL